MADKKTYKDTLNLPKTDFPMRAALVTKEPAIQADWDSSDLYGQIRAARQGAERFILHDGPPYANGDIHMGTALNKILKDIVVRIKTMSGLDAPYVPGWDCHGLPIEAKVMEELGDKAQSMDAPAIRQRCAEYADKFVAIQKEQFRRLGVLGEFDNPYITMQPQYESAVMEVFAGMVEQGLVYRQLKPVHWSIENRTALAEAELEYHDVQDTSVYVALALCDDTASSDGDAPASLLIWTTTPWTLPANMAVAVHPDFNYAWVRAVTADGPATWIVAEKRVETLTAAINTAREGYLKSFDVIKTVTGQQLLDAGLTYRHPLHAEKTCPLVPANYVTLDDGTGLVHTAPGHGVEDYGTGLKAGLDIYCPVLDDGTFDETAPDWLVGLSVWQANPKVVEHLRGAGTLVLAETITHSYPHDWRSKKPTIFRATEQWFVAVDRPMATQAAGEGAASLRELALEACRRDLDDGGVEFIPSWGRKRMAGMLESRPDWCISRQRFWGLPIPAFFNASGQALLTPRSVRAVARFIADHGSDAWFASSPGEILADYDPRQDEDLDNGDDFTPDKLTAGGDIFDVWFESGSSWSAVAIARNLVDDIPVDLYLEGSDQHRGWFQLSLLPALGARGSAPYKTVLTHGFVVTEDGRKMSKSLGNAIGAVEQLDKRGADVLRLWVASQNYQDDVRCSDEMIDQASDAYRKIRNTLRFCMGACADFDPATDATEPCEHSIDLWMRMQLHELIRGVRQAYDRYEFHRATRLMYEFCTVQASSIYLSAVKDRLYCESPDAIRRRASQTIVHEMLLTLLKLLAPILPHTCHEAWGHVPARGGDEPASIHLARLPNWDEAQLRMAEDIRPVNPDQATFAGDELQAGPAYVWDRLLALRQAGLVKLEALRNAGVKNPLDCEAVFRVANDADAKVIETYLPELEDLLGVGFARMERTGEAPEGAAVKVDIVDVREKYARCARSWKRRPDVGSDADHDDLCARDAAVIRAIRQ